MTFRLFVDSSNGLDVEPEYTYLEEDEKIEDIHRTRTGRRYHYKWGDFVRRSIPVMYVDSNFKSIVNSWWDSNANLLFMEEGGTEVFTVRIVNGALPIGAFIRPYDDLFSGIIELESY